MNKIKLRQEINDKMADYLNHGQITRLNPVKRQIRGFKTRSGYNNGKLPNCPECNSKLLVEVGGAIVCSQDKLKSWYNKCLEYDIASKDEQIQLLKDDNGSLLEFYDKWKKKDANGNRIYFSCTYSNRLHQIVPSYNWHIADPIQVKTLERKLKRRLFESELNGTVKVLWKDKSGKVFEEKILIIRFPWDL